MLLIAGGKSWACFCISAINDDDGFSLWILKVFKRFIFS